MTHEFSSSSIGGRNGSVMPGLHVRVMGEPPMPPADADFAFVIDFAKGEGNPKRIFEAAVLLIGAFETLDRALTTSIAGEIKPLLVVEDVETGSIKVWLKNILKSIEDDALRDLDWRPLVGKYLVRAKYLVLEFLDNDHAAGPRAIPDLREALRRLAVETDARHLPDYAPVHEGRLVTAMDRIQDAKRVLDKKDRLTIETEDQTYEVDLDKTWQPSAEIEVDREATETVSEGEVVLTVRKPDMIKDSMWQFTHGKLNMSAPIKDEPWLDDFHARKIPILPGDALKCRVQWHYKYDEAGKLIESKMTILKVLDIIPGSGRQGKFDV